MLWQCRGRTLDLGVPRIMGILNLTPDSFSDGGRFNTPATAAARAAELAAAGADIIDLGAESTRPGAAPVSEAEELDRLLPALERCARTADALLSVDTSRPAVMRAAVAAGAVIWNDVRALTAPGALKAAADLQVGVILMHMQGQPADMQRSPRYRDLLGEIRDFLEARLAACRQAGIAAARVLLDPGFGFGKTRDDNYALLAGLPELASLGRPLAVGLSRKSMWQDAAAGAPPVGRLWPSLAGALLAAERGARVIRVHDVAATRQVLAVLNAVAAA